MSRANVQRRVDALPKRLGDGSQSPRPFDVDAARNFKRSAFKQMNPVASLWSYADASPFIVAIFES
jgi:hypothetical protein